MSDKQFSIPAPKGFAAGNSRVMVDIFGGDELTIDTAKGPIRFEFSDRFGPMAVTKTGAERTLGPKHPFWRAVSLWKLQGSRVEGGMAIWHEPRKPVYKKLGGRNLLVVEDGEPGHDW